MSDQDADTQTVDDLGDLKAKVLENRGWFIALGGILIVLGIAAILFPWISTIAAKTFLGSLILIGGITQVIHAFQAKGWQGFLYNLLIGLLYVVLGGWLALFPLAGIIGLTVLLGVAFALEGILEIGLGLKLRGQQGWVWMIVSGVIAILAGVFIVTGLPSTAAWAIGFLAGINLLSSGWSFLSLALAAGKE